MEIKYAIEIIKYFAWRYPRDVGVFNMAIIALKKQLPMTPDEHLEPIKKHMGEGKTAPFCPVCGEDLLDENNDCYMYCPECKEENFEDIADVIDNIYQAMEGIKC